MSLEIITRQPESEDTIFSIKDVEDTAQAYNTTAHIFPGMAHDMMLEADWQDVADHIRDWLTEHNL